MTFAVYKFYFNFFITCQQQIVYRCGGLAFVMFIFPENVTRRDEEGEGSKMAKFCVTYFINGPLHSERLTFDFILLRTQSKESHVFLKTLG